MGALAAAVCLILVFSSGGHPPVAILLPVVIPLWIVGHGAIWGIRRLAELGTAGSTSLVLQTVLPALISASGPSRIELVGGTHNPLAPPFEFLELAYFPLLARIGQMTKQHFELNIGLGFQAAKDGNLVLDRMSRQEGNAVGQNQSFRCRPAAGDVVDAERISTAIIAS